MDSLIFELQIVFYFQLFLSANVRHNLAAKTEIFSCCCCVVTWTALRTKYAEITS